MSELNFINESQPVEKKRAGSYGFDRAPKLLFSWSRLFQSTISQAGTYLLTGKFHNSHCAIYKCEGGCNIPGVNELVLKDDHCYFDYPTHILRDKQNNDLGQLADLITYVVLHWEPIKPVDSMLNAASEVLQNNVKNCSPNIRLELEAAIEKTSGGSPFGGDALSDFFDWNPFSKAPIDRDYLRYCLVNFNGETDAQVDQQFADEDLGEDLRTRINVEIKKRHPGQYYSAMCCSSRRDTIGIKFWVNTGRMTQIDGWKTQAELEDFITSGEPLKDKKPT